MPPARPQGPPTPSEGGPSRHPPYRQSFRTPLVLPGLDEATLLKPCSDSRWMLTFNSTFTRKMYTDENDANYRTASPDKQREIKYGNNICALFLALSHAGSSYHRSNFWSAIGRGFSASPEFVQKVAATIVAARTLCRPQNRISEPAKVESDTVRAIDQWIDFMEGSYFKPVDTMDPTLASNVEAYYIRLHGKLRNAARIPIDSGQESYTFEDSGHSGTRAGFVSRPERAADDSRPKGKRPASPSRPADIPPPKRPASDQRNVKHESPEHYDSERELFVRQDVIPVPEGNKAMQLRKPEGQGQAREQDSSVYPGGMHVGTQHVEGRNGATGEQHNATKSSPDNSPTIPTANQASNTLVVLESMIRRAVQLNSDSQRTKDDVEKLKDDMKRQGEYTALIMESAKFSGDDISALKQQMGQTRDASTQSTKLIVASLAELKAQMAESSRTSAAPPAAPVPSGEQEHRLRTLAEDMAQIKAQLAAAISSRAASPATASPNVAALAPPAPRNIRQALAAAEDDLKRHLGVIQRFYNRTGMSADATSAAADLILALEDGVRAAQAGQRS